jgi:hypothetical protein
MMKIEVCLILCHIKGNKQKELLVENEEIAIMIKNAILCMNPLFYACLFYAFWFNAPCQLHHLLIYAVTFLA